MSESQLVAPPPHNCVGTNSEEAGKATSCQGCPNQQICATTPKGPDPDVAEIVERMKGIKKKILILSGKGLKHNFRNQRKPNFSFRHHIFFFCADSCQKTCIQVALEKVLFRHSCPLL